MTSGAGSAFKEDSGLQSMTKRNINIKSLLVAAICVLAIAASAVWIYRTEFAAPQLKVPLHRAVGQVMAEEVSRLLGHHGEVVLISMETARAPELKVQIEEFESTLKRIGNVKIKRTYTLETEGKAKYGVGSGLSGRRYVRIVNKNLDADALVSFVGAPTLSNEELQEIPKRPKFIAESRSVDKLNRLFESKAIDLAIVSRFTFPAPVEGTPRTGREWFDKYFEIATPDKAATLPAVKSE